MIQDLESLFLPLFPQLSQLFHFSATVGWWVVVATFESENFENGVRKCFLT